MPNQAVILTAGEGIRLRPLTVSRTKGMIPVANKPILEYIIQSLAKNNIRDIVMVVGYKKEIIMSHFEDGSDFNVSIKYVKQRKQLGTAHALMQARDLITNDFITLPGDNIISPEGLTKLITAKKADATLLVTDSDVPSRYGVVGMSGDSITLILEKPKITGDLTTKGVPSIFSLALWAHQEKSVSNIISTGICKFKASIFNDIDAIMAQQKYTITDLIQYLISNGKKIKGLKIDGWADAVYPWDLLEINALALKNVSNAKSGRIEHGAIIRPPVAIGSDSVIRSNSYLLGPVVIGSNCEIGPNTCIFPSTSIGNNVTIDPFTEIRHSVIMDDCQIGASSTIANSIMGHGCNIGSHFISESTKQEVKLKKYHFEIKNIGSIIGEDSSIGHSVAFAPGIIVGSNCKIATFTKLTENVPNHTQVM